MQAWNWGAQAPQVAPSYASPQGAPSYAPPQVAPSYASPQAFPGQVAQAGQVAQVYQSSGQVAQSYPATQMSQGFPAAPALVPGQQLMTNYQQFYGGAMPTASTEVPAGYTAQQWEAAQQQHFMQWQQWNQQYQQWQQEYGNTYSMAVQGGQMVPPPSSTAEPPPLPPPDKPPPPPEEGRSEQPNFQIPPPDSAANFKGQKRPTDDNQSKYQGPVDKKQRGDNFQQFGRDGTANTWGSTTAAPEVAHNDEEDRSEQERVFDSQFLNWEGEFLSWKEQNINHPDKNQYIEYEKKWTKWRQELLQRREQMRRKRIASMAKGSPDAVASKGRSKGDRPAFQDSKNVRNQGSDPGKDPARPGEGFGFRGGANAPANGKPEIKSLLDLPLQFTGQYAKKGYGHVDKPAEETQKPLASQQAEQNKTVQKTWAPNFQGPLQPKINFNFNTSGGGQFENGSSQPTYGPHPKPVNQNVPTDPGQNPAVSNQDFTQDVQLDSVKPLKGGQNPVAEISEIIDITDDKEPTPNYDFLKKSSVIPGLDLFGEKPGDVYKKVPSTGEGKSGQEATQRFEFLKGGPNKGLLPPPGFGDNNPSAWQQQQQAFVANRPGQAFQGSLPYSANSQQPAYFGQGGHSQNVAGSIEGHNFAPGNNNNNNQAPPYVGPGNQNPSFNSPGNVGGGPNFASPGNKGQNQNVGQGNQSQNFSPVKMGAGYPGNHGPNFSPNAKGPNAIQPGFGSGVANTGQNNAGPNFGAGNLNSTNAPGNQGSTFNSMDQMNRKPMDQVNRNLMDQMNRNPMDPMNRNPMDQMNRNPMDQMNRNPMDQMNRNPMDQMNRNPMDQMNRNPMDPMNRNPMDQMNRNPMDQMNRNPMDQMNRNPLDQMNRNPMDQMNRNPMDQMNRNPMDQMNRNPMDQMDRKPMDQMNRNPMDQMNRNPMDQMNRNPMDQMDRKPMDQMNRNPMDQMNRNPMDQMNRNPMDQMNRNPMDPMNRNPIDQMNKNPMDQMNRNPMDPMNKNPMDQMNRNPMDPMNKNPMDQMDRNPMDQMNRNSMDQMNRNPMDPMNRNPMDQMNRTNQSFGSKSDPPEFARDQPPHRLGQENQSFPPGGPRDWGDNQGPMDRPKGQHGPNDWKEDPDSSGPWSRGGRDSQRLGTREDFVSEDVGHRPGDKFPVSNFPPKDGFGEGKKGFLREDFSVRDKFGGPRDVFPKEGPNFPSYPREGFPRGPDVRDRGPDFRGPRGRFPDDRDLREPFPDRDFVRERFARDRLGPGGYPEREYLPREPFRGERTRGERGRSLERGGGAPFFPRERDYDRGWGGGRQPPPHDFYRPRHFDEREGDRYWDRPQRSPGWDAVMEPVTIVDYGHKPPPVTPIISAAAAAAAKLLENVKTFDYAHGAIPRNARDPGPPLVSTEPWRRDESFGARQERERELDREKRHHEREGRWERDRDRDRGGRRGEEEDRFRGRQEDGWGRRGDGDRDRNPRPRDGKRDSESARASKGGPPPAPPPPPSFSTTPPEGGGKGGASSAPTPPSQRPILVEDLLSPPGRDSRPQRIVVILRGPPGSGKSFVAKLIKDKEVEMGGPPPRILCLDDYFMVEVEKEEKEPESGRKVKVKVMEYEYEAGMEKDYRCSLVKAFKKTVNENYFPFVIVDCVNQLVKNFEEMWSYAKQKGFQVYICEMDMDVSSCIKRNTHNRTEKEIAAIVKGWEETPKYYLRLDVRSLLQSVAITEVEMEDSTAGDDQGKKGDEGQEKPEESAADADEDNSVCISKWERMEPSEDKLDRLDGLRRLKLEDKPKTLEDWLQLSDDYDKRETKPGQKRVRWADLEEKREQEKMRAIGFVVGQTDWSRMTDPTRGESALTQTKYI